MIYLLLLSILGGAPLLLMACMGAKKKKDEPPTATPEESKPASSNAVPVPPPDASGPDKLGDRPPGSDGRSKKYDSLAATDKLGCAPGEKTAKEASKASKKEKEEEKPEESQMNKPGKEKTVDDKTKYNITEYMEAPDKTDKEGKDQTAKTRAATATKEEKKEAAVGRPVGKSAATALATAGEKKIEAVVTAKSNNGDKKPEEKAASKEGDKKEEKKDEKKEENKKEEKIEAKKAEEKLDHSQVESVLGPPKDADGPTVDVDAALAPTPPTAKERASGRRSEKRSEKTAKSHCGTTKTQTSVVNAKKPKERKVGVNDTQCTERSSFFNHKQ